MAAQLLGAFRTGLRTKGGGAALQQALLGGRGGGDTNLEAAVRELCQRLVAAEMQRVHVNFACFEA